MIVFILIMINITIWGFTMIALDNLNQAVAALRTTVDNLVIPAPADNSADIQAAADSINASIATLNSKIS